MSDAYDERWARLLVAARAWRGSLIPKTSTGVAGPTAALVEAIEAFDAPCSHPRLGWVFHRDGRIECSSCTTILTADVRSALLNEGGLPSDEPGQ